LRLRTSSCAVVPAAVLTQGAEALHYKCINIAREGALFMSIVFCTTCKNRTQHLKLTLPQNLADNPRSKFVVLDYNSQDDLLSYVKGNHDHDMRSGRLVVYSNREEPVFKMAHAKNMAHRLGIMEGADILVNLDADNLTGPGFEEFVSWKFRKPDVFLWSNVKKGEGKGRGLSGRIAVTTSAFRKVGGYDEKYDVWGPDDKDFNLRLRKLGLSPIEIDASFLNGVPHNNRMRFREYPHADQNGEENFSIDKSTIPCVRPNSRVGFGCGTVVKAFDDSCEPIVLKQLPNKIFGIGMHKTATTSLHHALEIMGFDSWHWLSAHTAKAIWREMNNDGTSPTIDRYDALSDLPIPMLYKQLDEAYPGSKFVLTLRDEESWLDSVRRHFSDRNPWRAGWSQDPFTNRVHQVLYGRQDFHAGIFRERYRRHNREVFDYFRDRPGDLLVMEMGVEGARPTNWEALCKFVDAPRPLMPYPSANGGSR
jgi:hypothetical protein